MLTSVCCRTALPLAVVPAEADVEQQQAASARKRVISFYEPQLPPELPLPAGAGQGPEQQQQLARLKVWGSAAGMLGSLLAAAGAAAEKAVASQAVDSGSSSSSSLRASYIDKDVAIPHDQPLDAPM